MRKCLKGRDLQFEQVILIRVEVDSMDPLRTRGYQILKQIIPRTRQGEYDIVIPNLQ